MSILDNLLKARRAELSELRKELRKWKRGDCLDVRNELEVSIKELDQYIRRFMKSKMDPVKVEGIVINRKIYEPFMKKIKGLHVEKKFEDNSLVVYYGKSSVELTGKLVLQDLTPHFEPFGQVKKTIEL